MHWSQYASPSVQREWSRVQAELRAKETREYRIAPARLDRGAASFVAQDIAGRICNLLGTKWHGTKHEVVVRVLFPLPDGDQHILLRATKMDPWSPQQASQADNIVITMLPSAKAVPHAERSLDGRWETKEVYTGTAIDDTWRSAIGMGGGKPWGSKHHA